MQIASKRAPQLVDGRITLAGKRYCTAPAATREFGCVEKTIRSWASNWCPALGRRIASIKKRVTSNEHIACMRLFLEADLTVAVAGEQAATKKPGSLITLDAAVEQTGVPRSTLRLWCDQVCPAIGRTLKHTRKPGQRQRRKILHIDARDLADAIKARENPPPAKADRYITAKQAEGMGAPYHLLKDSRVPRASLGGASLKTVDRGWRGNRRFMKYRRGDVERILSVEPLPIISVARPGAPPIPVAGHVDAKGIWLPTASAFKAFGLSRGMLSKAKRHCAALGRAIRWTTITALEDRSGIRMRRKVDVFLLSDLKAIASVGSANADGAMTVAAAAARCDTSEAIVRRLLKLKLIAGDVRESRDSGGAFRRGIHVQPAEILKALQKPQTLQVAAPASGAVASGPSQAKRKRGRQPTVAERDKEVLRRACDQCLLREPAKLTELLNADKAFVAQWGTLKKNAVKVALFRMRKGRLHKS